MKLSHSETRLDNLDLSEADAAWVGAWISADGCITDAGDGRPRIQFKLTDKDVLDRMTDLFGGKVLGPYDPVGLGKKPTWHWQISGRPAQRIVEAVWVWLSQRRQDRFKEITSTWSPRSHQGWKLTPSEVDEIKARLAVGAHGIGRQLAREFKVSDAAISAIKHGRMWC